MVEQQAGALAAMIFAAARTSEVLSTDTWQTTDLSDAYWCMIDLRSSSAFRQSAGEKAAFLRMRTFISVYRTLCDRYDGIDVFKELGDAVLVRCGGLRSLCEVLALADAVRALMEAERASDSERPTLEVRSAISFGPAFSYKGDYFGEPIDRVARISRHVGKEPNILAIVEDTVRMRQEQALTRELPYVSFELDQPVDEGIVKPGERNLRVSAMLIDRKLFARSTDYLAPVRLWLQNQSPSLSAEGE